jgi:hypothetical protein
MTAPNYNCRPMGFALAHPEQLLMHDLEGIGL